MLLCNYSGGYFQDIAKIAIIAIYFTIAPHKTYMLSIHALLIVIVQSVSLSVVKIISCRYNVSFINQLRFSKRNPHFAQRLPSIGILRHIFSTHPESLEIEIIGSLASRAQSKSRRDSGVRSLNRRYSFIRGRRKMFL